MNKALSPLLQISLCTFGYLYATSNIALAQVTPDNTPINTQVNPNGNVAEITGGETRGSNLFHSFQDFSVPTGNQAFFDNANDISNIFSRVTGGNISNIDGLIRANGSANLFLVNPAGIIFGENAMLDIGGSFYSSSASSILFEDGEFSATDLDNPPLLTINAPIGLSFRDNPGDIVNRSVADDLGLEVRSGQSISLLGGNVNLSGGKITAPDGVINLGGLIASGEITIDDGSFVFPRQITRGNVVLSSQAEVNVRGDRGGAININANRLELTENSIMLAGIGTGLGSPEVEADDISINTNSIFASNDSQIRNENLGFGNAGDINITTGTLEFTQGSIIVASTFGRGNAGNIIITAEDLILLENGDIRGEVLDDAVGNGGNIEITASSLTLTDNSLFNTQTLGQGDAGNITINTTQSLTLDNESTIESSVDNGDRDNNNAFGNAGNINITTGDLRLNKDSQLRNISFARGNAGNITVNASGEVFLDGSSEFRSDVNDLSSGEFDAVGNAGTIDITATEVILNNNSTLESSTSGQGNAGNVIVNAENNVSFDGNFSGIFSQVRGSGVGEGGSISITAGDSITLSDLSILLANTAGEGRGNAGRITINAGETFSVSESLVLSQIEDEAIGNAGGIDITASTIDINNFSLISTNVQRETSGVAGNINLNGANTIISEGAVVDALTENDFDGGNITFSGGNLAIVSGGAVATSTDSAGNAGNITLDLTGDITIDGTGTIPRPEEVFQLSEQVLNDLQESTGLFATSSADSTGSGGNIQSNNSGNLTISNNGIVSVGSEGGGDGGILTINTNSLNLNDRGEITAVTRSGSGGNINLIVEDIIRLRNNALISAEAFNQANGGNINIDTDFIIAFPNQVNGNGSDIIASAAEGNGGEITINAQSLLGIFERKATANNQTNDIDASSEFGLDGNISINTPDTDALEGVTELPQNVIETEQITAKACAVDRDGAAENTLTIQGKGGVQSDPATPLSADLLLGGEQLSTEHQQPKVISISTAGGEIIPARGVEVKPNGEIFLTPYATDNKSVSNSNFTNCSS